MASKTAKKISFSFICPKEFQPLRLSAFSRHILLFLFNRFKDFVEHVLMWNPLSSFPRTCLTSFELISKRFISIHQMSLLLFLSCYILVAFYLFEIMLMCRLIGMITKGISLHSLFFSSLNPHAFNLNEKATQVSFSLSGESER